jgi:hypothetical protein
VKRVSASATARCLLMVLALCTLAACAKKAEPTAPGGATTTYPRAYPHE